MDWLDTINSIAGFHKWPDNFKIELVSRSYIKGKRKRIRL